ncbi:MAG: tRNA (adenosine(37)-N6)-threonylcarbamoyltransferase complex ATPase subunit type 1 TsaE [Alphaproteobacteria bacterium]
MHICKEENIIEIVKLLSKMITKPCCVALYGDIGAGKTTFVRAFIRHITKNDNLIVRSPTFTIIQEYITKSFHIWHCDLYRISFIDEIKEIGILEALHSYLCFIEWPDRLDEYLPTNRINIFIEFTKRKKERCFSVENLAK